ncbi:MAG: rod shape-determining protein MreC [Puniceicoccales bacterium]|jgi:rod shape-determining protein MreC|nr:rod shape-determining protein MreC [Puniceicoccales bacterium]
MFHWRDAWHSRLRYLLYFFLLVGTWWLIPLGLRHGVRDALQEFQAPIWHGAGISHEIKNNLQLRGLSKGELITEIETLSRELAYVRLAQGSAVDFEDPQVRLMAKEGSVGEFETVFTRILRRDEKAWWQEVVISGGRNRGFEENMAIVNGRGLLGKICRVFSHHSIASLATDQRFRTVAHVSNDPRPIIFQGIARGGLSKPVGRVTKVPLDVQISEGRPLKIVTSSLSGVYPDGVPIGIVTQLRKSSDGVFQEGEVALNSSLAHAREAVVLIPRAKTDVD